MVATIFTKLLQQQALSQQLLLRKGSRQTSGGPCVRSALLGRGTAFPRYRRRRRRRAPGLCCASGLAACRFYPRAVQLYSDTRVYTHLPCVHTRANEILVNNIPRCLCYVADINNNLAMPSYNAMPSQYSGVFMEVYTPANLTCARH
jgi:hypothetical protein